MVNGRALLPLEPGSGISIQRSRLGQAGRIQRSRLDQAGLRVGPGSVQPGPPRPAIPTGLFGLFQVLHITPHTGPACHDCTVRSRATYTWHSAAAQCRGSGGRARRTAPARESKKKTKLSGIQQTSNLLETILEAVEKKQSFQTFRSF
jgi:hypothetical protein